MYESQADYPRMAEGEEGESMSVIDLILLLNAVAIGTWTGALILTLRRLYAIERQLVRLRLLEGIW